MQDEVTVTQEDREAAELWRWSLWDKDEINPTAQVEADLAELAEAFARHRQASTQALVEALEAMLKYEGHHVYCDYVKPCGCDASERARTTLARYRGEA